MNYRFQHSYTAAQSLKWQIQATSLLNESQDSMSAKSSIAVIAIQFCLWVPIFYFLYTLNVPFVWMAPMLFLAFLAISIFYDAVILPHVAAMFDKQVQETKFINYESVIEVDEEAVRTCSADQEITFKWDAIRDIHDSAASVILLTKTGYCFIPAKCFDGFLAKDAFVRACVERISGRTEQGAYFT